MSGAPQTFGGGDDDAESTMIAGINVTPLVDITLVLLIIFMVTATVIVNAGIKVELPKAASGTDQAKTTLAVTVQKDGTMYLNGQRTSDQAIIDFIGANLPRTPDLQAVIAADRAVPHGDVVHVIDLVKRNGVRKFAINVEPDTATVRR